MPNALMTSGLLVVDGHDGSGKSSLAARLAARLGARVVKPFANELGDHLTWLWRLGEFTEADLLARRSVERVLDVHRDEPLIFDRQWATLFTVFPPELWSGWEPVPRTIICHANPETTMNRLTERGEDPRDAEYHSRYEDKYVALAERFGTLLLDTTRTDADTCFGRALEYATSHLDSEARI